jgi:hypothetical protein
MGLDVYVGTLTRYYAGDWETVAQQWGREQGVPVHVFRAGESSEADTDPNQIRDGILQWRDLLSNALRDNISVPLDWNETAEAPYFTDKPDWVGYASLLLWAAYAEHPNLPIPSKTVKDWPADPAYKASIAQTFQTHYDQLLYRPELWLPCDFNFTFRAMNASGSEVNIGSSKMLLAQLDHLNLATWNANSITLQAWRNMSVGHELPLETYARFGFAIFKELAEQSVTHGLVMQLDY